MNSIINSIFTGVVETSQNKPFIGVVTAIVTNNQDPDGLGRVKIRFSWSGDEDETPWARVALPMAGNDKGTFFIPEIDDEVLVAFEMGNENRPYIIGVLWNGQDSPPETNVNIKKIKSTNGHEVILDDESDVVQIKTSAGDEITLESGSKITIKSGENSIELDKNFQELKIKSGLTLSLESQQVNIKGTSVEISADAVLTLKGGIVRIN